MQKFCTDRHIWSTGRIVQAFRGQWNVEELFRRAKKGGVAPWGPSHQRSDNSLRLHTFATVIGLELVSLARVALGTQRSARGMMKMLSGIEATQVQVRAKRRGRPATILLAPELTREQQACVETFGLGRWNSVFFHLEWKVRPRQTARRVKKTPAFCESRASAKSLPQK